MKRSKKAMDIDQFTTWDGSARVDFYKDASFTTFLDDLSVEPGFRTNFAVQWEEEFQENFPVQFFVDHCTVTDQEKGQRFSNFYQNE